MKIFRCIKNVLFFISVTILISITQLIAQDFTFDKAFGELNGAWQVVEREDSSLIVAGNITELGKTKFRILNISKDGSLDWKMDYDSLYYPNSIFPLAISSNNNTIIISSLSSGSYFIILKIDKSGKVLWRKSFISPGPCYAERVAELKDKNILTLIAKYSSPNISSLILTKIDSLGKVIWQKEYSASGSIYKDCNLFIVDGGFIINSNNTILRIDTLGNVVWSKTYSNLLALGVDKNDNVIFYRNSKISKLNSDGDPVWEKNFYYGNIIYISKTNSDGFIATTDNINLLKFDTEGEFIEDNKLRYTGDFISQSLDGGYIICGNTPYPYKGWVRKTDSLFEFRALEVVNPTGPGFLNINNENYIEWFASKVDKINIDLSLDNGKSWLLVIHNYPTAPQPVFNWLLNNKFFSDSCFIKITDVNDPSYYDMNDYPFSISSYKPAAYFSGNEIFMWIENNGSGSHDPIRDGSGFYWPGGDSATIATIFADGLVWGGKVNGEIRANGSTYRSGLLPGFINPNGKAKNPFSTSSQIFKIKKDWELLPESDEKLIYEFDYNHWPIEAGAPWDDVNVDGVYTPSFDKPKFIGDETLFYVANDLDTATSRYAYGSDPIGLEFQTTIFGFNREDLKDVVFKKYKVINKSNTDVTDMYFTYWADDDMGYANDDFEGFDSTMNMGYCFNGDNNDEGYYGTPPPAVGHMIVQGPIVPASSIDSARYDTGWNYGYKNLGMTSSGLILKNAHGWPNDVPLGVYEGTLEFYNYMKGLNRDGSYIINPLTGEQTIWPLTGDPVSETGWYEGAGWPGGPVPGDHRYHVPTGPFNLVAGDTQEVVYAIMMAKGTDNINSITKLRELAAHVQEFYNTELVDLLNTKQTVAPTGFTLYQNYPNPFNPKTTIEYEVPEKSFVTIKIYDILGREVQTLVNNEEKVRWKYKVVFDASTLASGVYFYRLQAGSFTETKKMMVLK
jgi:hypothetical protein